MNYHRLTHTRTIFIQPQTPIEDLINPDHADEISIVNNATSIVADIILQLTTWKLVFELVLDIGCKMVEMLYVGIADMLARVILLTLLRSLLFQPQICVSMFSRMK